MEENHMVLPYADDDAREVTPEPYRPDPEDLEMQKRTDDYFNELAKDIARTMGGFKRDFDQGR